MNKEDDKKVLDFFMDDSAWLKKSWKKPVEKEQKISPKVEKRVEVSPTDEIIVKEDVEDVEEDHNKFVKESGDESYSTTDLPENGFGEVDYAILKSIAYDFKTTKEIAKALQIRTIIIEKHIYRLIKEGFIKYFQHCVLTSKGKDAIIEFERSNPEDVWKPIDEFIISVVEHKKEQKSKTQKTIDLILLISVVLLIILIIYFGVFS